MKSLLELRNSCTDLYLLGPIPTVMGWKSIVFTLIPGNIVLLCEGWTLFTFDYGLVSGQTLSLPQADRIPCKQRGRGGAHGPGVREGVYENLYVHDKRMREWICCCCCEYSSMLQPHPISCHEDTQLRQPCTAVWDSSAGSVYKGIIPMSKRTKLLKY